MPSLSLRLTKRAADEYVLTCVRPDGSIARNAYRGPTAQFFPRHDLTHYMVETELGMQRGFYGLVAEGWNLGDFGSPWPRGKLPEEVDPVELAVSLFDREIGRQKPWTAEEYNALLAQHRLEHPQSLKVREVTEHDLRKIRTRVNELAGQWTALPIGQTMELVFALSESSETTSGLFLREG